MKAVRIGIEKIKIRTPITEGLYTLGKNYLVGFEYKGEFLVLPTNGDINFRSDELISTTLHISGILNEN